VSVRDTYACAVSCAGRPRRMSMALGVRGAWGLCEDCEPWDCAMCRDCIYMGSIRGKHSKTHLEHKLRHGSAVAGNSDGPTTPPLPSLVKLRASASSPRSAAAANGDGDLARPTTMYFLEEATAAADTATARSPPSYTDAVSSTTAPVIDIGEVCCCPLLGVRLRCCCCSPN
jgi:hypothetical protein